jgi:NADH:quinone reductase (non-electrogenic)
MSKPRVVIVGGGFGGLTAAQALKRAPVEITLLDRANHHLFQPLLYQVATAALSPGDIASPIRWILRAQKNVRVLMAEVTGIDLARRLVHADGDELPFDFLILAPGSTHAYFGHNDWARFAPGLKTLDDALGIRRRVLITFEAAERESDPIVQRRLLTFVIVGGGPTGVELAGALAEIARRALPRDFRSIRTETARVVLVEAGPSILPSYPESLRSAARASLEALGVEVRERTAVTGVEDGLVRFGDETIEANTVLWAAGVAAAPLLKTLGVPLDRAGRVSVEPDCSIAGHPDVFVIGDAAAFAQHGSRLLPGVAPVAQQQGKHVARTIVRSLRNQPREPFRYVDRGSMATIGRGSAIADFGWLRLSGFIAWLGWLFVHIMQLVGFRSRVVVFGEWAWAYITEQRRIRLITGVRAAAPSELEPRCE